MSPYLRFIFFAVASVAAVEKQAEEKSPVTKIVNLIKELKEKIVADGKAEQNMYNKYACWCENTAKPKENKAYMDEKTEMDTTLNALQRAIEVLSGAGTKTALLQEQPLDEMTLLGVGVGVHQAIKMLPSDHVLSAKQISLVSAFAKDPAEFYDQKAEKAASYNPASATIQGILKDMYDTFSMNLEKGTETEAVQKKYESLIGVKENEMATLIAAKEKKEGEKAEAE